jgi:hypothetical protein
MGFTVALVAVEYFLCRRASVARVALAVLVLTLSVGLGALFLHLISVRATMAYLGFGVFAACYLLASRDLAHTISARTTTLLFTATTCFGLVHGFGIAGFLMETGILGASLPVLLLGFNLGVEIGQLIIIVVALSTVALFGRRLPHFTAELIAAALCGLGLFWFVGRTLA